MKKTTAKITKKKTTTRAAARLAMKALDPLVLISEKLDEQLPGVDAFYAAALEARLADDHTSTSRNVLDMMRQLDDCLLEDHTRPRRFKLGFEVCWRLMTGTGDSHAKGGAR